ncbi:hypothetical protein ACIPIC_33945 [Streptomyces collinus]|uniref:hypothetical protein n=1 Tax=Streptomyces collinus TaxID=42684 RepID=UPI00382E3223
MARKKLVFASGGQPVHRACQPTTGRAATRSAALTGTIRAPKDIGRAELLKRIEALRKRDAEMKPRAAKCRPPTATSRRQRRANRPVAPPLSYHGVEKGWKTLTV